MSIEEVREFLNGVGLPSGDDLGLPDSTKRFADGGQYRIEIPSTEGPRVLAAVLAEGKALNVPIHRVSQGSGVMMLTDGEIREMAELGRNAGIEVSLFVGPRAAWDTGAQVVSAAGRNLGARLRGMDQVVFALEDVRRACGLGIRSVLAADEGMLWAVDKMKKAGELPESLVQKVSVQMGAANPISIKIMQEMGAGTYNIPTDLSLPQISAIRHVVDIPLDVYIEVPDDFGGFVRYYELPELIRIASPVYVKLGIRNSPGIYPSGQHLEDLAIKLGRERVRRAAIALEMIGRHSPDAVMSPVDTTSQLGIPEL